MYKICFYVPVSHAENVKQALFKSGAGKIGHYTHCAWQVLGEGQFIPLVGSHAFVGQINKIEKVAEYKVEVVCETQYLQGAIAALMAAHPYEEPAYHVIRLEENIL